MKHTLMNVLALDFFGRSPFSPYPLARCIHLLQRYAHELIFPDYSPGVTPRDEDPNSAGALMGINFNGSSICKGLICRVSIAHLKRMVDSLGAWGQRRLIL